ncbi:RNA polymerase sigma-I factor [Alkalibacillus haloalkaliphilus]|uniref:RNA polymerase sigma-I factor n=1 Tax=Alkalibacillus haloalkaliphilus TaxID=94136 RepID=UPI00030E20B4|nr:RNA polymerase sigma-I factor [Alkalibacillus haloalkaliphilus]
MLQRLKNRKDVPLEEQVRAVQHGDEDARHHLLSSYQPFIATSVSKVCKRYIDPERDDEFSVGFMAFNEAIDSYSEEKGSSFLTFARLVITRKVIDYIRKESVDVTTVSLDQSDDEEEQTNAADWRLSQVSKDAFEEEQVAWYRQMEIEEYNRKLEEYKLSFSELVSVSPKHQDAKESAKEVARFVYENKEFRKYVLTKKRLPIKKIEPHVNVSKKTIERNRKYILAVFVLLVEDFTYLKEYVQGVNE